VLHCALLHIERRGNHNPEVWKVAADIVVNGMLLESGFEMLEDGVRADDLSHLSTEEVYERLLTQRPGLNLKREGDLLEAEFEDDTRIMRGYWQNVVRRAATLARLTQAGLRPFGKDLELVLGKRQVNWRDALMRYLAPTQNDCGAFDTRLIYRSLYVETLASTGLTLAVHIDTSGSLADAESEGQFLSELKGILNAYPGVRVCLTYGDTDLYGPFELTYDTAVPPPKEGGGTSFVPFFESVGDLELSTPLVVFTDGYGVFPTTCDHPCLWVVTEGGVPSDQFPFGEVTRLAS